MPSRLKAIRAPTGCTSSCVCGPLAAISENRRLRRRSLTAVLWAAAGVVDDEDRLRTVTPSAGALYPLRHYYLNLRATGTLSPGAYALSASGEGRLHYS